MSTVLLDAIPARLVREAVLRTEEEKARRAPLHMVHRWWSRRFTAIYRLILASYLFEDGEEVLEALDQPAVMRGRARGRVFFEPFAGGGTGLAEAALAGFDVYGLDVNPVAVVAARASLLIATQGLPEGFAELFTRVLAAAKEKVGSLWEFDGKLVTYILVTRGRVPTWLSVVRRRRIALCPRCHRVFEAPQGATAAACPSCGSEVELTSKPVAAAPPGAPEVAPGWRAFAVELRWRENGRWRREYLSVAQSEALLAWLARAARTARELSDELGEALGEVAEVHEASRLRRAGIERASRIFAPHQLASLAAYAEASRSLARGHGERLLLAAAASEAAKCCSLLAKWYPPLGECVPASGVKALWVPEYTAVTNPLASDGLQPLARGTLASALRAQLKAASYVERMGGASGASAVVLTGDALEAALPPRADLVVLDPPYGKVKSYAALSTPHFYSLKLLARTLRVEVAAQSLGAVESREISPQRSDFQERWRRVVERVSRVVSGSSRVVLMFNALTAGLWAAVLEPFKASGLHPTAVYWVLGEPPRGITASKLRGMHLIVFRKGEPPGRPHVVCEEPLQAAARRMQLDKELERKAFQELLKAL
jgi:DNA-directed RNA polymerase subunit RPC12/RpoP